MMWLNQEQIDFLCFLFTTGLSQESITLYDDNENHGPVTVMLVTNVHPDVTKANSP